MSNSPLPSISAACIRHSPSLIGASDAAREDGPREKHFSYNLLFRQAPAKSFIQPFRSIRHTGSSGYTSARLKHTTRQRKSSLFIRVYNTSGQTYIERLLEQPEVVEVYLRLHHGVLQVVRGRQAAKPPSPMLTGVS